MQRIAVYDLDKTITRAPTWTPFLLRTCTRTTPWRLVLLPFAVLATLGYALRLIDRGRLKEVSHALLLGRLAHPIRIDRAARRFADAVVARGVQAGALQRIAADRADGCAIVMATASYRFYAEAIGERLGFDHVIGTRAVRRDTRIVARIAGRNCYGAAKLEAIEAWLAGQGLARGDVHVRFYSDHVSDEPTFSWADEAFAVRPHRPLRRMAAARAWTVLDWAR